MFPDDLPLGTVVKLQNRQFMNLFLHLNLDLEQNNYNTIILEQYNYRKENIFYVKSFIDQGSTFTERALLYKKRAE